MRQHAANIVRELRQHGFQAYFAGGCVRDMLLGLPPTDYDVATDATPQQVMRIFPDTYAVGAQFGVVLVPRRDSREPAMPPDETNIEASSAPSTRIMSRWRPFATTAPTAMAVIPDHVSYSKDPREDVQRRDFTINGMLLDPLENNRVLDFVGGRDDLQARHHPRHRRSGTALLRRQAAHAAGGALCRALHLCHRAGNVCGHPATWPAVFSRSARSAFATS